LSRKAFFFGSFLLTLIKRNELAPSGGETLLTLALALSIV
jgi:hypothetical protein